MSVNYKNTIYRLITDKRSVPFNSNGTGTIETVGTAVKGTATLFTTEMPVGSWLTDEAHNEVRKVLDVESDTLAYVGQAFSVDIAAMTTPSIIHAKNAKPVSIALQIPSGQANGTVDGEVFPAGTSISCSKDSRDHSAARDLIDPFIVDATGSQMQILIQY